MHPEEEFGQEVAFALANRMQGLLLQIHRDTKDIVQRYEGRLKSADARNTALSKLANSVVSAQLALVFLGRHLFTDRWWREAVICDRPIPGNDIVRSIQAFHNCSKMGFIQLIQSSVESSFRTLLRAIAPGACYNATGTFMSVYQRLLLTELAPPPTVDINVLEVLRLVRNLIHNNGVYYHRDRAEESVIWQGETYMLHEGVKVEISWVFLIRIADAIREMLAEVLLRDRLVELTDDIPDPITLEVAERWV